MTRDNIRCYLCGNGAMNLRAARVRDNPTLRVMECGECGLVQLNSFDHIHANFYQSSGMHGERPASIDCWLLEAQVDDQRRFEDLQPLLVNKRLLDFGCGAGGFLFRARAVTRSAMGVELEHRVKDHWADQLDIVAAIDEAEENWDVITAFHVLEHLLDPIATLKELRGRLSAGGQLIVEVPSANDALLQLYNSEAFENFTYWSQHLFLFTPETLNRVARLAGLNVRAVKQFQRYPLSNHLHWLSRNEPGGHRRWSFLDSPDLGIAYEAALASIGQCDTLIAYFDTST